MKPFITAYGKKTKVRTVNNEPSMTKQSFRDEANVNFIVSQYQKTGMLQHREVHEGQYGEFADLDYHTAMNIVTSADQMFQSLPSNVRNRFANDPALFLDFVQDPENQDEMAAMGLREPIQGDSYVPRETAPQAPSSPAEPSPEELP